MRECREEQADSRTDRCTAKVQAGNAGVLRQRTSQDSATSLIEVVPVAACEHTMTWQFTMNVQSTE